MAWTFKDAQRTGRSVRVRIENQSAPEGEQDREFTYTLAPSDAMTQAQFRGMVKGEVRAHLASLNGGDSAEDVSAFFTPA